MASASPAYVLLRSEQYLRRASNDVTMNPTTSFTVSVTLDPEAFGSSADGTVVAKSRTDNNDRGWRVEYIASSGHLKLTLFGALDGSIYVARETAAAVRTRQNVTFTYSTANGMHAYVDGAASDGTSTSAGSFTSGAASAQPLSIGADGVTNGGGAVNVWKGQISMVTVITAEASAADVSGITADGTITAAMLANGALRAYWRHDTLTANASNDFTAWVDSKASLALTAVINSGVKTVKAQPTTGSAILAMNLWDVNLNDLALGGQGLTTTYSLSGGYRLWAAATVVPQIASSWRSYMNDFTMIVRCRKVTGRTSATFIQRRGVNLTFTLASGEVYCIVGDSGSSTNKRISWGFNLFPVEGQEAVIVLRYNSVEKDVDLFINQFKYTKTATLTGQAANETTTGLFVSDSSDFVYAVQTAACLSDAQVDAFVLGLSTLVYGPVGNDGYAPSYVLRPDVVLEDSPVPGPVDADLGYADETLTWTTTPVSVGGLTQLYVSAIDNPYVPKDVDPDLLAYDEGHPGDPLPAITSATLSASGNVTAIGAAGPYNCPRSKTWWEISVRAGEFMAIGSPTGGRDFYYARNTVSDSFQAGPEFDASGSQIRLAVQPYNNAGLTFYSAPVGLSASVPTDPDPTMVSVTINSAGQMTAVCGAGPTDAGAFDVWYEIEQTLSGNDYLRMGPIVSGEVFATNRQFTQVVALGSRTGWTGKRVRLVMRVAAAPAISFTSDTATLTDYTYTNPSPAITSVTVAASRVVTAVGTAGPTTAGTCSTWWEIEFTAGTFLSVIDKRTGVDCTTLQTITDNFTLPAGLSVQGKKIRFVVQPDVDPSVTYTSAFQTLSDPVYTSPTPTITSATCTLGGLLTASATTAASNGGPAKVWWEMENDPGEWTSVLDTTTNVTLNGSTRNLSYQLPSRFSVAGKGLRLVIQSNLDTAQVWYSPSVTVTQTAVAAPTVSISTATVGATGAFHSDAALGVTNLGSFSVHWEVYVQGDFQTLFEAQTVVASASASTSVVADVSVPAGLNLEGKQVRLVARSITYPDLSYTSDPFTVVATGSVAPNPAVTSAVESPSNVLSVSGTVGPTSVGPMRVWFQVDDIGTPDLDAIVGERTNVVASSTQVTVSVSLQLPNRLDLTGRSVRMYASPESRPDIVYVSTSSVGITVQSYTAPSPAVLSAGVSAGGVFTATGQAGPSDIGSATSWWEVAMTPNKFVALMDKEAVPSMASSRQHLDASVTLPANLDLTGKSVRLAIQQDARPDVVYYSSLFAVTTVAVVVPPMTITAANVSAAGTFTASVTIGQGNLGNVKTWWEVEITAGTFTAMLDTTNVLTLPDNGMVDSGAATLPNRFDLTGKSVRYAIQDLAHGNVVHYSGARALVVEQLTDPSPTITSLVSTWWRNVTSVVRAGPTNAALCKLWWEVDILGDGTFTAVMDTTIDVNLFTQQTVSTDFLLPKRTGDTNYSYNGKSVRFVVQTNVRPELTYKSAPVTLTIPAPPTPQPVVTNADAGDEYTITFRGQTTRTADELGPCTVWFEVDMSPDLNLSVVFAPASINYNVADFGEIVSTVFILPPGWDLRGKSLHFCVAPNLDPTAVFRSPAFTIIGDGFNRPSKVNINDALAGWPGPGVWLRRG
jgi:hypothetical protein